MMRDKLSEWSRTCRDKSPYKSRSFAKKIALKIKKSKGVEIAIYKCPHCSYLHLTSKVKHRGTNGARIIWATNDKERDGLSFIKNGESA